MNTRTELINLLQLMVNSRYITEFQMGYVIGVVDDTDKPTENDYCSYAERRTDGSD